MTRHKKDPSLRIIFFVLLAVVAAVYGGYRVYDRLETNSARNLAMAAPQELEEARTLIDSGKLEEAREILQPVLEHVNDPAISPRALTLLADLEIAKGDKTKALGALKEALDAYPGNPERPALAIKYAGLLEETGESEEAVTVYREVGETAPPELRAPALTELGKLAAEKDELVEARDLLRRATADAPWDTHTWNSAIDALGQVNVALVFAARKTPESEMYAVDSGDTLTDIGNKLNVTQGMLMRANGLDEGSMLHVGQGLKYTPKDFRIVIERSTCRLFLLDSDGIFKRYYCGLGREGHETTLGSYKIGNKQKDPTWYKPGGGPIPPGDPSNELGTRWMPLVPLQEGLPQDLGIHGTIAPDTIGQFSSSGCARMLPDEVEELYDLVVRSTPVDIVEDFPGPRALETEKPSDVE